MKLVILESPFAGDIEKNLEYARKCMKDCLERGEAPMASHLLYTQPGVLNDNDPEERMYGIDAGHAWIEVVDYVVVYADLGISSGMQKGIEVATKLNKPVYYRSLP